MSIVCSPGVRFGLYLCHSDAEQRSAVELSGLIDIARRLPEVVHLAEVAAGALPDPFDIVEVITRFQLEALVLAGVRPGQQKPVFTRALALAGRDPAALHLVPLRAAPIGGASPYEDARDAITRAVRGTALPEPRPGPVHPVTLVVGGGIAGIQAALEIADADRCVILVERGSTIGGHMAMFDKTFPTLDCAACILTPKMVALSQHPMIQLMTCTEVEAVSGTAGAFHVTARRRARRVDVTACVACDACAEFCPVSVVSEFDAGIATRKAIYRAFPQAVPSAYVVDPESCTYLLSDGRKCGACLRKCAKDAIHLSERDEIVEFDVGNIVVATGYDVFDARRIARYGYGTHPNVVTALEFERLTNASGPTGGRIVLRTPRVDKKTKTERWVFAPDGPAPRAVAIVHCVGSRDEHYNRYCSRVCCMYSLMFAHLVREKLPEAECYEFYIDMRAYGKGYEEFFNRIREEGVHVVRGRSARVTAVDGRLVIKGEDILSERLLEFPVDMVLLSVGLEAAAGAAELARAVGITRDADGWFQEADYNVDPTGTNRFGVYVAGACQGPKDIPDTVAQASAVAARVLRSIWCGTGEAAAAGRP